jgi:hypothetical protein
MVASTGFGITFLPSRSVPSASETCSIEHLAHAHHVTIHNTTIDNILSTGPQLSISQKVLGTLPEDGNVMPKHE